MKQWMYCNKFWRWAIRAYSFWVVCILCGWDVDWSSFKSYKQAAMWYNWAWISSMLLESGQFDLGLLLVHNLWNVYEIIYAYLVRWKRKDITLMFQCDIIPGVLKAVTWLSPSLPATIKKWDCFTAGISLGMGSANGRRCYNVTSSLIGWIRTQSDLCTVSRL